MRLEGKQQVQIVCMDLAVVYRSIVRKQFPKGVIVAGRFDRLVNYHFLACWREVEPVGSKNRVTEKLREHFMWQMILFGRWLAQFAVAGERFGVAAR